MNYKTLAKEILENLEEKHICLYHSIQKEAVMTFIDDFFNNNKIENDFDFVYFMHVILKKINSNLDAHTEVRYYKKQKLPFYFLEIDNDIYLINTINKYKDFLFLKLTSINNIPVNKLLEEIEKSSSYQTESWLKYNAQEKLSDYYELLSLPSIDPNKEEITFMFENGNEISLNLNQINELKDGFKQGNNDSKLVYPLKRNLTYYIKDSSIVFNYNKCDDKNEELPSIINEIKKEISNNNIDTFILDLRGNTGGNSAVISPLIEYLKESNLNLITLVDRNVFSSGTIATTDMIDIGSTIIGEEIGAYINGFGQCTRDTQIQNFEYRACINYYYRINGNRARISDKKELESSSKMIFVPEEIIPDIIITPQIEDLKNGKDVVLEYALNSHKKDHTRR